MVINISIQSKDLYLIGAVFIFLIGAGIVIAGTGTPSTNGHSYNEVGIPTCPAGKFLKSDGNAWVCGDSGGGAGRVLGGCEINCNVNGFYECGELFGGASCNSDSKDCVYPTERCNCPANTQKFLSFQGALFDNNYGNLVLCVSNN